MLTYVLKENNLPLYEQVYQYIKADILNGVLKPGEKLPSKRTFANHNGIYDFGTQRRHPAAGKMARVFPAQACMLARGASPVRQLPRLGAAAEVRQAQVKDDQQQRRQKKDKKSFPCFFHLAHSFPFFRPRG